MFKLYNFVFLFTLIFISCKDDDLEINPTTNDTESSPLDSDLDSGFLEKNDIELLDLPEEFDSQDTSQDIEIVDTYSDLELFDIYTDASFDSINDTVTLDSNSINFDTYIELDTLYFEEITTFDIEYIDSAINDISEFDSYDSCSYEDAYEDSIIINDTSLLLDCGEPPLVENGERTFVETTLASSASYVCDTGYERVGAATISCGVTGLWGTAPTCVDIDECVTAGTVCTAENNVCTNVEGSWECSCEAGFTGAVVTGGNASCVLPTVGLGEVCTSDSQCSANSWCSTVTDYRRCSPRVFGGNAHQMDFVFVPSGTYLQGRPDGIGAVRPYTSTLTRNYFVSTTEVTQAQWKEATEYINPAFHQNLTCSRDCLGIENNNDNGPIEQVNWYSAVAYANWLSLNQELNPCYTFVPLNCANEVSYWAQGDLACSDVTFEGLDCTGYRLLTESEWERAARGNTTSTYYWGETSNLIAARLYAWFGSNSGNRTQPVGTKLPNAFGLYDMSGNVWEWVWDWYASAYPITFAIDYLGPLRPVDRVMRSGNFNNSLNGLSSYLRFYENPLTAQRFTGFRLARTLLE
jgi:formylglycine-generating enzyme required for sulfatase activity